MKISSNQYNRAITPSNSGEKERDESFIARNVVSNSDKNTATIKNDNVQPQSGDIKADQRANLLNEQHKQDLARQLAEKQKSRELQQQRSDELNMQRQLESRSAANRDKLKESYATVQKADYQNQSNQTNDLKNDKHSRGVENLDPINLIV